VYCVWGIVENRFQNTHPKPNTLYKAASQVILKLAEAAFLFGS
jgi:hypothetical protein